MIYICDGWYVLKLTASLTFQHHKLDFSINGLRLIYIRTVTHVFTFVNVNGLLMFNIFQSFTSFASMIDYISKHTFCSRPYAKKIKFEHLKLVKKQPNTPKDPPAGPNNL
jgi:hypothetical protein